MDKGELEAVAPAWSSDTGVTSLASTNDLNKLSMVLDDIVSSVTGMTMQINYSSLYLLFTY